MRTIMILNPKGGCGKSTLATNLASYFATQGKKVSIMDFDPQGSSTDWLKARPAKRPPISGVLAWKGKSTPPRNMDVVIMDVPAATHGTQLAELLRRAQTAIIPVLPSPMDMRAATHFVQEIIKGSKVGHSKIKLALVANRVREFTLIAHSLWDFLKKQKIPVIAHLRDSQNYIRAAERGLGVYEMAPYAVATDLKQWDPIVKWVNSKRSMPGR